MTTIGLEGLCHPRSMNDAAYAQAIWAICQAVRKPDMRFVPVKSVEQLKPVDVACGARYAGWPAHPSDECSAKAILSLPKDGEIGIVVGGGGQYATGSA